MKPFGLPLYSAMIGLLGSTLAMSPMTRRPHSAFDEQLTSTTLGATSATSSAAESSASRSDTKRIDVVVGKGRANRALGQAVVADDEEGLRAEAHQCPPSEL